MTLKLAEKATPQRIGQGIGFRSQRFMEAMEASGRSVLTLIRRLNLAENSALISPAEAAMLAPDWNPSSALPETRQTLLAIAARYFLEARTPAGKAVNAVARFHLGNGAQLEHIHFAGDLSSNGLADAHGLMVNYLYNSARIEANAQRFAEAGEIAASAEVKRLARVS